MDNDYPLLTVIIAMLAGAMAVQLFGQAWDSKLRTPPAVTYECDFNMGDHVVTKPCEIRSVTFSDN